MAKKKATRRMAKNAACKCGEKFVKQKKTCPKCGANKPTNGWKAVGNTPAKTAKTSTKKTGGDPTPAINIPDLTMEASRRLANAIPEVTLETFKSMKELTLEAVLADERCPDWITAEYDEGQFAEKLRNLPDETFEQIKESTSKWTYLPVCKE